jgi:hypothetical protein
MVEDCSRLVTHSALQWQTSGFVTELMMVMVEDCARLVTHSALQWQTSELVTEPMMVDG